MENAQYKHNIKIGGKFKVIRSKQNNPEKSVRAWNNRVSIGQRPPKYGIQENTKKGTASVM